MVGAVRAMDRKVLRDLWHLRGQVLAIGLVVASGVAVLVMSLSTHEALQRTSEAYYERYRLAHVFGELTRAPEHVADRIAAIPGVQTVETRVVRYATIDVPGFTEPVMGRIVSLPDTGPPLLNQLVLRAGRWLRPDRRDEVVLNEPFAEAHGLQPGDRFFAVLNGKRRALRVAGIALSPEFIYSLGPGSLMPDDERFGVMWMSRSALAAAFDLDGAFNDVSLALFRGADPRSVIQQLDAIVERYGSIGSIERADQLSNWFVMNEISQLETMSTVLPTIFLVIAAFLTNMLLHRLLATERSQIGAMKAFGYSNAEVGLHYAKIVVGIALLGVAIGALLGNWFGRLNTELYATLFRFPLLLYRTSPAAIAIAGSASLAAALSGGAFSVWRAVRLPPAEAMQAPPPPTFRRGRLAATRIGRWLDQPSRIVLRNVGRWPLRSAATSLGIASSVSLLVLALQWQDCFDYLAQSYFFDAQRQHVMIGLAEERGERVVRDIGRLPGVLAVEPMRIVPADLSVGTVTHRGSVTGVPSGAWLQPIYDDARQAAIPPPAEGLVLGSHLARKLGVGIGDAVEVQVLDGRRPFARIPVADLVETYIAMPAYLETAALNRLLGEGPRVEYVSLLVDRLLEPELFRELKSLPIASGIMLRQAAIDSFHETVVENLMVFVSMFSALACILGFGVAYNSARIALSERGRELATLRVLGFTRGETAYILLGEVGLLVLLGLPVGCVFGRLLAQWMAVLFETELFRVPLVIEPSTYGAAAAVALGSALLSAGIVGRRVAQLDLIEVLKTRE